MIRDAVVEGGRVGVAVFNIRYDMFGSRVRQGFESEPESACLADSAGHVFYSYQGLLNSKIEDSPLYAASFAQALRDGSSVRFEGGRAILAVRSADGGYVTLAAMSALDIAAFQRDFAELAAWASAAGLLAAFFLALGISFGLHRNVIRLVSYVGGSGGSGAEADSEIKYILDNMTAIAPPKTGASSTRSRRVWRSSRKRRP